MYVYVCVCVYKRYVVLNVYNIIYIYTFYACVCRVCIHPRLHILAAIVIYIIFMIFTRTPSLVYKYMYCILFFPDDYFIQLETIVFINIIYTLLCWTNKIELPLDKR